MTRAKRPSVTDLVMQIENAKGNISAMARAYKVSRSTVYGWIQASATAQEALADQRETVVDVAESVLFRMVIDSNITAVAYVLNNSPEAKRRGWGPRHEHSGPEGGPITVQLTWGDTNAEDDGHTP